MSNRRLMSGGLGFLTLLAVGAISNAFAATIIVTMTSGNTFAPRSIILNSGDTVTWQNPAGGLTHNVIADDGSFNSPDVLGGQSFSHVFTAVGTVPYHCGFHGAVGGVGMSGIVFVGNRMQHAASEHVLYLNALDFGATNSTTTWSVFGVDRISSSGGTFWAGVELPTGTEITGFEMDACDTDPGPMQNVHAQLIACSYGGNCFAPADIYSEPGACPAFYSAPPFSEIVDDVGHSYFVAVLVAPSVVPNPVGFASARIFYKSPIGYAPATATFTDVPTSHPFFRFVEALYASGVTGGCGGGNYCPDAPITRGQMAVFLAGALGLFWAN